MDSWFFGRDKLKQKRLEVPDDEWRSVEGSVASIPAQNLNCHGRGSMEQCWFCLNSHGSMLTTASKMIVSDE
jgi:hypothetical protein